MSPQQFVERIVETLIYVCQTSPDVHKSDQDVSVFLLELLLKIVLQNRDRVTTWWSMVRNHFYSILIDATEKSFYIERTCIGLLRHQGLVSQVIRDLRMRRYSMRCIRFLILFDFLFCWWNLRFSMLCHLRPPMVFLNFFVRMRWVPINRPIGSPCSRCWKSSELVPNLRLSFNGPRINIWWWTDPFVIAIQSPMSIRIANVQIL